MAILNKDTVTNGTNTDIVAIAKSLVDDHAIKTKGVHGLGNASLFTSYSDVTASRALGTEYQNTSSTPLFIAVTTTFSGTGVGGVKGYIGTSSADGLIGQCVIYNNVGNSMYQFISFIVPAGYYYKADKSGSKASLYKWIEWY